VTRVSGVKGSRQTAVSHIYRLQEPNISVCIEAAGINMFWSLWQPGWDVTPCRSVGAPASDRNTLLPCAIIQQPQKGSAQRLSKRRDPHTDTAAHPSTPKRWGTQTVLELFAVRTQQNKSSSVYVCSSYSVTDTQLFVSSDSAQVQSCVCDVSRVVGMQLGSVCACVLS
jgi:hypothetical protein